MGQLKKSIVYIGNFKFPLGNAVAKRALGLGMSLKAVGYQVLFIGEEDDVASGQISEEKTFQDFVYCNLHHPQNAKEHYLFGQDLRCIEKKLICWKELYDIQFIIFCGTKNALMANSLLKICKKHNIKTIADSMDWLSSRTGNLVFDVIKQMDTTYEMRCVNMKADAVVCISDYLGEFYRKAGKKTVVIPPLSPYIEEKREEQKNDIPTLVYAGIPCRLGRELIDARDAKDRLDLVIDLLYEIHKLDRAFKFLVYGMEREQYEVVLPRQKEIVEKLVKNGKLCFKGYQNENIIRTAIQSADYTILLRDKNRSTSAGFPTKIAESIALGTPVITTVTSDVQEYLTDNVDSYFIDLDDINKAKEQLLTIFAKDDEEKSSVRMNVSKNISFLPQTYAERLDKFIKQIR